MKAASLKEEKNLNASVFVACQSRDSLKEINHACRCGGFDDEESKKDTPINRDF